MKSTSKRLSIFSNLEEFAFYGLPDFDDEQRSTYFVYNEQEWKVISKRSSLHAQVYCAVQIGYFRAKNIFFRFSLNKIPRADLHYIILRYFSSKTLSEFIITKHEHYLQRQEICDLFGYQIWSQNFLQHLKDLAKMSVRRDIIPNFIAHELLDFLKNRKIVRPGYTTLQKIISHALTEERNRLKFYLKNHLKDIHKQSLNQLIQKESTLSELAALKQDAKSFSSSMMVLERQKHRILKPLYNIAKNILSQMNISQQNIAHYASLAHHYTIYDLERFEDEQTYLYLLCYVFKRYQQINDNLVDAFNFNVQKLENEIKEKARSYLAEDKETSIKQIGRLLLLYVDEELSDSLTLGETREQAFAILPKESIRTIGKKMLKKPQHNLERQWKERDKRSARYKHHLRPLFMKIDFVSQFPDNPLLKAIQWMKKIFSIQQSLTKKPFEAFPHAFISKRLKPYLLTIDKNKKNYFSSKPVRNFRILPNH